MATRGSAHDASGDDGLPPVRHVRSYVWNGMLATDAPHPDSPGMDGRDLLSHAVIAPDLCSDDDRFVCVGFAPSHFDGVLANPEEVARHASFYAFYGCAWSMYDRHTGMGAIAWSSDLDIHSPIVELIDGQWVYERDFVGARTDARLHPTDQVYANAADPDRQWLATCAFTLGLRDRPIRDIDLQDGMTPGYLANAAAARMAERGAYWAVADVTASEVHVFTDVQ